MNLLYLKLVIRAWKLNTSSTEACHQTQPSVDSIHLKFSAVILPSSFQEQIYKFANDKLDIHESVHHDTIMQVTNKMQLYRLIYYS